MALMLSSQRWQSSSTVCDFSLCYESLEPHVDHVRFRFWLQVRVVQRAREEDLNHDIQYGEQPSHDRHQKSRLGHMLCARPETVPLPLNTTVAPKRSQASAEIGNVGKMPQSD